MLPGSGGAGELGKGTGVGGGGNEGGDCVSSGLRADCGSGWGTLAGDSYEQLTRGI